MTHEIGTILNGKINNITERGVYVTIDNTTFGFLPNKKMPSLLGEDGLYSGEKYDFVKVVVEKVRPDNMLLLCDISYWMKKRLTNEFKKRYEPGTIFPCEVKKVSASHAEILVDNSIDGIITKEHLGWNVINKVSDVLYVGELINAVFVGEENGKLMFGLKYLQEKPYDEALYDLSIEDLLKRIGHSGTEFIGECQKHGEYLFLENLYSANPGEEGKILVDQKYGYNLRAIIVNKNCSAVEGSFYKFHLVLLPKEARLERNQLFQFKAEGIQFVPRNPFSDDVLKAFKKNTSPATNITAAHLLAEVGKNMYSSKDRMFFELIQNADDASSETGVSVSVKTEGDYLTIVHNGYSFDRDDFEAITSAANGTKKANENKTGYKGIGFKSVFTDSEEVLIRTGGYQFKYQKTHPGFSDFERFYFFVNELSTDEQKAGFLERFSREKSRFAGVNDIPWQLEPIWVKRENFPAIEAFKVNANVAIALKLGKDKIDGEKGYRRAIEDVIDNPKFMLFLRHTNRIDFNERTASKEVDGNRIILKNSFGKVRLEIFKRKDFSVDTSDSAMATAGFDIKRKIKHKEDGKIIEAAFVNSRNQEYESIPQKLAVSQSTEVSFAVRCSDDEDGHINPDTNCSGISMFAFLPTLVKEFKFPFFINANFVLDPPRQHILSDNPWNCFLMGEISELLVRWCAELSAKGEPEALNILPMSLFNESESDIAELAESFNGRYTKALREIPFILGSDNVLHPMDDILIDKTGLSKIIGQEAFLRALGSTKTLPSTSIECSILDKELFDGAKKVRIKQLASATAITTELNAWYSAASEYSKDAFITWLTKYSADLSTVIPSLKLFKVGDSTCAANDLTVKSGRLVCTDAILPIRSILEKLGFICSESIPTNSSLSFFTPTQSSKEVFEAIAAKDTLSVLSKDDKLLLVKHLSGFESVGGMAISSMSMFRNLNGEIRRMDEMMPFTENAPEWLTTFIICKEDNDVDIQKYLVPFESAFEKLVLPQLSSINADIKTIYDYFKWTDSRISKRVIDTLLASGRFESFINVVQELDKDTQKHYLSKIAKMTFTSGEKYDKDSFKSKAIQLALSNYDTPAESFSPRVFFNGLCILNYSVSDSVRCCYPLSSFSYQTKTITLSLARILPNYENKSYSIEKFKELFSYKNGLDKLFVPKEKPLGEIYEELNAYLGISSDYPLWRVSGNASQFFFTTFYRRIYKKWYNAFVPNIDLSQQTQEFINEMMDILYKNDISISSSSPFTYHLYSHIVNRYFYSDYVSRELIIDSKIEAWADNEEKEAFLIKNGVRSTDCTTIAFRRAFVLDEDLSAYTTITDDDAISAFKFLFSSDMVVFPVTSENRRAFLSKFMMRSNNAIIQAVDIECLQEASDEMTMQGYSKWRENHYTQINVFAGMMPMRAWLKGQSEHILIQYNEGDYYYDESSKILYINSKTNPDELLFQIARIGKAGFDLDDYRILFREGKTAIPTEELNTLFITRDNLIKENQKLGALIREYERRLGIDKAGIYPQAPSPIGKDMDEFPSDGGAAVIQKGDIDGISNREKAEAQLEAQRFLMQTQPQWQFPEHYGDIDETGKPFHYSNVEIIDENGTPTQIVLKSHKAEGEPLKINVFEWSSISEDNARIFVYTGDDIKEIEVKDLVANQPMVNISFSTENLDIEERISAFADSLHYFKELHFDFDSFNLSKQAKSLSGMYNVNDRRQGATSDEDL